MPLLAFFLIASTASFLTLPLNGILASMLIVSEGFLQITFRKIAWPLVRKTQEPITAMERHKRPNVRATVSAPSSLLRASTMPSMLASGDTIKEVTDGTRYRRAH